MKTVPLYGKKAAGRVALVDDEDYELVIPHRWNVREVVEPGHRTIGPYAITNMPRESGCYATVSMHKLITGWDRTDHMDHNGLNNQRNNLRGATRSQNMQNRLPGTPHSSLYKGVTFLGEKYGKWRAGIRVNGRRIYLGVHTSEVVAALAYDAAARIYHGEFACLNFPDGTGNQAS